MQTLQLSESQILYRNYYIYLSTYCFRPYINLSIDFRSVDHRLTCYSRPLPKPRDLNRASRLARVVTVTALSHPHTSSIRRLLLPKAISPLLPLSAELEVSEWPGQWLPCDERRTQGLQYCWSSLYAHWWTQHSHTMPCCSTPADLFHSPPLLPLPPFSDVRACCLLRKTLFSSSVIGRKSVVNTKTQIVL